MRRVTFRKKQKGISPRRYLRSGDKQSFFLMNVARQRTRLCRLSRPWPLGQLTAYFETLFLALLLPARTSLALTTLANDGSITVQYVRVFYALGREVLAVSTDAIGSAALALPAGLSAGVYVLHVGSRALCLTVGKQNNSQPAT